MKSVLISHSNREPYLGITLQLYRYLSARKIDCWVDALLESGDWDGQIGEVMYDASVVVFVASRNSLTSKEVMKEVGYFLRTPNKTVIPFVIDMQYYLSPEKEAAQAIYNFGANSIQAVFAEKYPDYDAAFERLVQLLPADIVRLENNPSDFVYGGSDKVLTGYKGSDPCVSVPPYVTEIAKEAFLNNERLQKIILPPSVEKIGIRAFFGCSNLVSFEGGEGLTEAEASAFDCSGLAPGREKRFCFAGIEFGGDRGAEEIAVPAGTRIVANEAFRYGGAKRVVLPEGLETIGELAFAECIFLENVTVPASVKRIGRNAFRGCGRLARVIFEGEIPDGAEEAFERFDEIAVREGK